MTEGIGGAIAIAVFMLVTSIIFSSLIDLWSGEATTFKQVNGRQLERLESAVAISSTADTPSIDCLAYTLTAVNSGDVTFPDFTKMDLLVEYVDASNTKTATRLAYGAGWSVTGITPDTRDVNLWNPAETATFSFTLPSAPKAGTKGAVVLGTPQAASDTSYFACTCTAAGDTGFLNATAEAPDTGGDNNGFELLPTAAFADGVSFASNLVGEGDRHRFYNYGFPIKSSCAVTGIEVRLDWWLDTRGGNNSMRVELSWDGGASWTAAKIDSQETTVEHTIVLGSPSDGWGRTWSVPELSNANFRARVTMNGVGGRSYFLDWVPARVTYAPP